MDKKMQVAIIGCGAIANNAHIPAYMENTKAEIKYFCDIVLERAEKAVEQYKCGMVIADYKVALNDPEIEAVSICVPNDQHRTISIDFLKAGKHVLCEKPAARTYEEALEMQEAQKKYNRILNIGVVNRFNVGVNKIKEMIEDGELGDIHHVYISFRSHRSIPGLGGSFTTKSISGGGVLIDWGVHFLDIVMYCCGDPKPTTVSSEIFEKLGKDIKNYTYVNMWAGPPKIDGIYDVEDSVTGMIRTEGPTITFNGAWAQNIGNDEMFIDFMGDKAGIRLTYGGAFVKYSTKNGMLTETHYKIPQSNMFQNEIDSFINCIEENKKLPSNIDTNIITSRIMDAIYQSAKKHQEVVL
jgi:predicted dehydrogenase